MRRRPPIVLFAIALSFTTTVAGDPPPARDSTAIVSRIKREPIESTALATVGYSKRLHALEIEFVNGAIYRYYDVPPSLYRALLAADSKARYYDQNIRRKYRSFHVRPRREK